MRVHYHNGLPFDKYIPMLSQSQSDISDLGLLYGAVNIYNQIFINNNLTNIVTRLLCFSSDSFGMTRNK